MATKRTKWMILTNGGKSFVSQPGGGIGWSYDRQESDQIAAGVGGVVVDAEKFVREHNERRRRSRGEASASA